MSEKSAKHISLKTKYVLYHGCNVFVVTEFILQHNDNTLEEVKLEHD